MSGADPDRIRAELLAWYDANRRDLPWRAARGERPDPYAVWVSEVMLQQTRVETVIPYFERWMRRYPTVQALAEAQLEDVLKAWEGLGYYSRARNLHGAVREVARRYGGRVPDETTALLALPGVGRYTAGAVASIAYGREAPVVDGNVRRVFARWMDDPEPRDADLWTLASRLVAGHRPGDLNQALMELGATVCTPRGPACGECPVRGACAARAAGTVENRPAPRRRGRLPVRRHGVAVLVDGAARTLLVRRPSRGLLAGLWEFPNAERLTDESAQSAARRTMRSHGVFEPGDVAPLCAVAHTFTHLRIVYEAFVATIGAVPEATDTSDREWLHVAELERVAMPRAQRRIAAELAANLAGTPSPGVPRTLRGPD